MENSIRLNTIKVEFGERCARPTNHELIGFAIMLELLPDDIHTLYQDTNDDCIYIKFNEVDQMKKVLAKHKKVSFLYNNGDSTEVVMSEAQGSSRYVRVFNVPPEIEDKEVREAFQHYGTVHSVEREKYPDVFGFTVYNGVRGVCIDMKKLMPAVVSVKNFRAKIFHRGLNDKCFLCHSVEHYEENCPKRSDFSRQLRRLNSEYSIKMVGNEQITHRKGSALNDPSEGKIRKPVTRTQSFTVHSLRKPVKFTTRNINQQNDDSLKADSSANQVSNIADH
jgi:RNA recognition motif-containing protein